MENNKFDRFIELFFDFYEMTIQIFLNFSHINWI